MLIEVKDIMEDFSFVNTYDAYQNINDVWEENLQKDLELIRAGDFYELGRDRKPNMVTKGSGKKKREEQDGWVGSLIPNELITQKLYKEEEEDLGNLKSKLADIESQLDELVENAKVEGTDEYEVLHDCLNRNKDDEPTNSFKITAVRNEKKIYEKNSEEYKMLKDLEKLMDTRTKTNGQIKSKEEELKKSTEDRIIVLKDKEIERLVYEKWFGSLEEKMLDLIAKPLKVELDILKELSDRYKYTLEDLEEEEKKLEDELQVLLRELVKN